MREVVFNGPAGRIEAKYTQHQDPHAPVALIMHPHPLHGGNMNNKVVYTLFHAFVSCGFSVLRFNFRGVGKSLGTFDNGVGELMDAAAAMDWLELQNPEASGYWLAGFSFGAWIALQLLMRRPEINGFIAVSPPANSYDFNFLTPCPAQGVIIQGTKDIIVPEDSVFSLYEKLEKQRDTDIEYIPINGADHFFIGQIDKLNDAVVSYVEGRVASMQQPKRMKRDRRRKVNAEE